MLSEQDHEESSDITIKKLLAENQRLIIENNTILRKMRRDAIIGHIFKVIWVFILLGVPLYLYFTYILPNWEDLKERLDEIDGLKGEINGAKELFDSFDLNI